ncbi:energy-coupling factor transporter transmembrane component T family protein [Paenibacillus hamazuiensis]|uniref:energy-coupling factor transporter transmembrane component T family protein n=1 Tax=Paenibacillus hamazuiensis TaxID=2936508 RepID=UPI0020109C38|nr:energy-coupling factor transporter transmembrane component T [Paenibacillus hamazuiensis]
MLPFAFNETWLHRINPALKLALSLVVFLFVLMTDNINILIYFTVFGFVLLALFTGHPGRRVLLLSLPFVLLFVSSSVSMTFFGKGDTVWFKWGLIRISEESFIRGMHVGLKTVNFAAVGLLFALTTRPVLLFYSLMQQAKLPAKYAYSFMAAMRLIPIMMDEFQILRQALKVRGVRYRRGLAGVFDRLKMYAIPLLAQSIRRAQRIAVAMEAKRFSSGQARTYYYETGFSGNDAVFAAYWMLAAALALYAGHHLPLLAVTDVRYSP